MGSPVLGALGVCAFLLFGGLLTLAQAALFSLREAQLPALAERSVRGRRVAALAARPERVAGTVKIGTVASAVGGAALGASTLAEDLAPELVAAGLSARGADAAATALVAAIVAYVALVIAELVPFRIAVHRAEWYALALAGTLDAVAVVVTPVRWMVTLTGPHRGTSGDGESTPAHEAISAEELREMVTAHAGLTPDERRVIEEVFSVGDVVLREVMVPRTEVHFLDAATPVTEAVALALSRPHSRYPVVAGSHDDVVGFVHIRDLLAPGLADSGTTVGELAREVPAFPATNRVLPVLSHLRGARAHLAIVVDEYGGTAGIVTVEDLVEELVGEIGDEFDMPSPSTRELTGGAVEVDGLLNLDDFAEATGVALQDGPYETVAGFLVARLGHIAGVGETVVVDGYRLEVVALDGRRVARVRVEQAVAAEVKE